MTSQTKDQKNAGEVLVYTITHGDRHFLKDNVPAHRAAAGMWFDWAVWMGKPSATALTEANALLNDPNRMGIQHLTVWAENRGQHYATIEAMKLAREGGYKWICRLDDDIQPKTKRWLKKMIYNLEQMKTAAEDLEYRLVAAPKIIGLRNPLQSVGEAELGLPFQIDIMERLGGMCRIHPVEFMKDYSPSIYYPLGRMDPESIADYVADKAGFQVRFPNIRLVHRTNENEAKDTPEMAHLRKMGHYWCYLGAEV